VAIAGHSKKPISIKAADGGLYDFESTESAEAFLDQQSSMWEWILPTKPTKNEEKFNKITNWYWEYSNHNPIAGVRNTLTTSRLQAFYSAPIPLYRSKSAQASIHEVAAKDAATGRWMLAWLFGLAQQISTDEAENLIATNPGAVKGRIQADRWLALFDADTTLNPINVKKYVDSLFNNLKSHVTAGENEVAKIKEARLSVERLSESMEPWTEEKKAKITLEIQVLLSTMKRDIE